MAHSDELLKSFADRLARAAATDAGASLLRSLRAAGLGGGAVPSSPPDSARAFTADLDGSEQVGIWRRKKGTGVFVRRLDLSEQWYLWANVGRIEPKRARRRVVLVGESVARGFLYDPQFTPAKTLEAILTARLGPGAIDVVDLARTNMGLDWLRPVTRSALLLEADFVVIFGGNNWSRAWFEPPPLIELATALRQSGVAGFKAVVDATHRAAVTQTVREIIRDYRGRDVRLVWVLPEFDLGDWRDPETNAPHLAGGGNATWLAHWQSARESLERDDIAAAEDHARAMVDTDGGTCATSWYLLAECHRRRNDIEAARRALELARDAIIWSPYLKSPRPYSMTHDVMREELAAANQIVIDLPAIFKEHLDGGLPDRRLFLDYVHLNANGIEIAMAAAAAGVLGLARDASVPWRRLLGLSPKPAPSVEAEAQFLAAVHNAHYRQSPELLRYYCQQALRSSPAIASVMSWYLDVQTRRVPMLMCRSTEQIEHAGCPSVWHYLMKRFHVQQLDRPLLDAIVGSLLAIGVDVRAHLEQVRFEELSVTQRPVDLLDKYYHSSVQQPLAQHDPVEEPGATRLNGDYYQAHAPQSKFLFVGRAGQDVSISLVCRVPRSGPAPAPVTLDLNGTRQGETCVGRQWHAWSTRLSGAAVRDGLNELVIRWPLGEFEGADALDCAAEDLLANLPPRYYPVFGEIHAFTAALPQPEGTAAYFALSSESHLPVADVV
jgi:hypothetical protein